MAVVMRLSRVGGKKNPFYRLVVADRLKSTKGSVIEKIGSYDPRSKDNRAVIDEERALHWLRQGAQPSNTVKDILRRQGIWQKR